MANRSTCQRSYFSTSCEVKRTYCTYFSIANSHGRVGEQAGSHIEKSLTLTAYMWLYDFKRIKYCTVNIIKQLSQLAVFFQLPFYKVILCSPWHYVARWRIHFCMSSLTAYITLAANNAWHKAPSYRSLSRVALIKALTLTKQVRPER